MEFTKTIATISGHINRFCYIQAIQRIPYEKRRIDEMVDWMSFSVIIIEFSADLARLWLEYQNQGMTQKSIDTFLSFTSKFALLAYQIIAEKSARMPESYLFYFAKDVLPLLVSGRNFLQKKDRAVNAMLSLEYFGTLVYRYATSFYQKECDKGKFRNLCLLQKQGNIEDISRKLYSIPLTHHERIERFRARFFEEQKIKDPPKMSPIFLKNSISF
jgi:hypothetical protein